MTATCWPRPACGSSSSSSLVFALGAGLAGIAGVVGGTFQSLSPGEDTRFLLASLVVVIVGGMGSIPGAALGAVIIGLAEQLGSVYIPTYAIVVTFLIMVLVLALRPQGLLGEALTCRWCRARSFDQTEPATARGEPCSAPGRNSSNPAVWLVALILADHAADRQRLLPDRDLRHHADPRHHRAQPDVPGRLWRHGQPDAAHDRGLRRLHGRGVRRQRQRQYQPGLAVVARDADGAGAGDACSARSAARSRCAPRASTPS